MTLPSLLFALVLASLCGMLFHLLRGGNGWRLLLDFGLSALGFALGQLISAWRGWNLIPFGTLDLALGVFGSIIVLLIGDWLGRFEAKK